AHSSRQPTSPLQPPHLFLFNDTATTEIYTLSLHDALPISAPPPRAQRPLERPAPAPRAPPPRAPDCRDRRAGAPGRGPRARRPRSEEHTSELQSRENLVCRLLLEKKKKEKVTLKTATQLIN